MKDKVSIITTFYNCENYILKCINSVWNQEISDDFDIEYILIDDNSEDKTNEIIDIFFKEYGQLSSCTYKIIKTPQNLGCGGARNFGIANSTGNYIMFLDADDYYIHNDFVLRAYNMIVEHDADIIEFGIKYINQNGERENLVSNKIFVINNNHIGNLSVMFYDNLIKFMPWTKILKRSIVETRPYDTSRTFEDIRTTPYWVYNANKIIIATDLTLPVIGTGIGFNSFVITIGLSTDPSALTVNVIFCLFNYVSVSVIPELNSGQARKSVENRCQADFQAIQDLKRKKVKNPHKKQIK